MNLTGNSVILLVDDKEANLLALENLLAAPERKILTAVSGKDALTLALNNELDLILLDVQMPDMDGFEVAQVLQSTKRTKNIPIIFATAGSKERKFVKQGYDEGAIDYLIKPLDPEVVKAKVSVLLKIQLQQKELLEKNISLQKSALLIENSADIIGIIDANTLVIEDMNSAFTSILGYDIASVKGKTLDSFIAEETEKSLHDIQHAAGEDFTFETGVKSKDEKLKWLQWKVVVKYDKWYVNARDITEQKDAARLIHQLNEELKTNVDELESSNKELESFSYSVSHDLRAPLRAMMGYSDILEETAGEKLDENDKRLLTKIKDSGITMGRLIDNLLEFSRLGRMDVKRSPIDMVKTVKKVLVEIEKTVNHKANVQINPMPDAIADYYLLQQVLINLMSNAIKYSAKKENAMVEIGHISNGNEMVYFVKDNGAGFDMKYASKLFGVFQRLHSQKDFEGIGIGLAIVQRIVARHGGKVWAEAIPNEGATFFFTLPVKKDELF